MIKLLSKIGLSGDKGLIGLISEKTGKISFKRSAAILILTGVVMPDIALNGVTWKTVALCAISVGSVTIGKLFENKI